MIELGGLFPELEDAIKVHGTAGEIFERIADEWGIEEEDVSQIDIPLDGEYPSTRAFRAQQLLEERIGKPDTMMIPDMLMDALLLEGLVRPLSDDEYDEFMDEEEMDYYEEARGELDEEWTDGVWET
jgi:hypothetical protein